MGEGLVCRVLILSSYADIEYVHQLTAAGASGYLIKQTAASDLIKAIRAEVSKRQCVFQSPSILEAAPRILPGNPPAGYAAAANAAE